MSKTIWKPHTRWNMFTCPAHACTHVRTPRTLGLSKIYILRRTYVRARRGRRARAHAWLGRAAGASCQEVKACARHHFAAKRREIPLLELPLWAMKEDLQHSAPQRNPSPLASPPSRHSRVGAPPPGDTGPFSTPNTLTDFNPLTEPPIHTHALASTVELSQM